MIALNTVETLIDSGWKKIHSLRRLFAGDVLPWACRRDYRRAFFGAARPIEKCGPAVRGWCGMIPFLSQDWTTIARQSGIKRVVIFGRDGSMQQMVADESAGHSEPKTHAPVNTAMFGNLILAAKTMVEIVVRVDRLVIRVERGYCGGTSSAICGVWKPRQCLSVAFADPLKFQGFHMNARDEPSRP